jgi:hypothetical protein
MPLLADALDIMHGCGAEKIRIAGEYHPINLDSVNRKFAYDRIQLLWRSEDLRPTKLTADRA